MFGRFRFRTGSFDCFLSERILMQHTSEFVLVCECRGHQAYRPRFRTRRDRRPAKVSPDKIPGRSERNEPLGPAMVNIRVGVPNQHLIVLRLVPCRLLVTTFLMDSLANGTLHAVSPMSTFPSPIFAVAACA